MKKTILTAMVILIASAAQAREIYWTGEGLAYGYNPQVCDSTATMRARLDAVNSCTVDFGYSYDTCKSARSRKEVIEAPYYDSSADQTHCTVRIYLSVP